MGRTGRRRSKPKRRRVEHSSTDQQTASSTSSLSDGPTNDDKPSCSAPTAEIPEFDPSVENARMDLWLANVNKCAAILNWDDSQTAQSALKKLAGEAKKWYQSQACVLRTWTRWQDLLSKAFPHGLEYPELLEVMLNRRYKIGEDIEEYYYDKMSLLFACHISGRNAVDCVIHGIEDTTINETATLAFLTDPEDLFAFLKEVCHEQQDVRASRCA